MDHRNHPIGPADLRFVPPALSVAELREIARREFGVEGEFEPLEGERDQNHRITTAEGRRFVLKISSALEDPGITDFQIQALLHLERVAPDLAVPRLLRTRSGEAFGRIESAAGESHIVRLLTYLPGVPYAVGRSASAEALRAIGHFQGRLCRALSDFSHPYGDHFMPWDQSNGLVLNPHLWERYGDGIRDLSRSYLPHMENEVFPALAKLRHQVIHNDSHSENVLRADERSEVITGVIDFGDMVEAPLVDDLAVSIGSFGLGRSDLLAVSRALASGFHEVLPLEEGELDLLYDLILVRLVLDVLLQGLRCAECDQPDSLAAYRASCIDSIRTMMRLDRVEFDRGLREACGPTTPKGTRK